ncbi:TPA_asm: hypothetical protein vir519_00027 [Caudoviricetes sp. vir519]|nr:TPA_asm: hypothetical protein vir519_00027 [Caudoviricetes sp. vir519]
MKCKAITAFLHPKTGKWKKGEIREVPDLLGETLVRLKKCERIKDKKEKKEEEVT